MKHTHKLLLFYAAAVLAAFDAHALVHRFFLPAPDPVAWEKVLLAALLQAIVFALAWPYLMLASRTGASFLGNQRSLFFGLNFRLVPILALGVIAALSVMVLYNAINCGNHPLPTNRGMSVCPR